MNRTFLGWNETDKGVVYKVDNKGKLNKKCFRGNDDSRECLECDDLLSRTTNSGIPKKVICRGSVVDSYKRGKND